MLCDNLDVASNLLLGSESSPLLRSTPRFHEAARELLADLGIALTDTTRRVGTLSGGERQLVAVARAMASRPKLLVLDEPTTALGVNESAQVDKLMATVRERGTTVLLISHDIDQIFRLADRIVVLRARADRRGRQPSRIAPRGHRRLHLRPAGRSSARRQLSRLHGLADQLASAEPSSSLPLIVSALAGALGRRGCVCISSRSGGCASQVRLACRPRSPTRGRTCPSILPAVRSELAAHSGEAVIDFDIRSSAAWAPWRLLATEARVRSSWSVPVMGADGVLGVITVFREVPGYPPSDERQLVNLYAGYIASAVERERLLGELTGRNRVLETIRVVLETLAGPPFAEALTIVLNTLREGLLAERVALLTLSDSADGAESWLTVDSSGAKVSPSAGLLEAAAVMRRGDAREGRAASMMAAGGDGCMAVRFVAPDGGGILIAQWRATTAPPDVVALMEDTANSLRLAREREESERARQEASALRRSRELQRGFLSRLSHELRTPLTAIGGYASSLMAPDVTWDRASETRFLTRIGAESARLGRLVGDLLDFSAIESSTMRMLPDWCELPLVIDAAIACLSPTQAAVIDVDCQDDLPVIWADHDRLEQVFLNLLENALRHNPPGTRVVVNATGDEGQGVVVTVTDDGGGLPRKWRARCSKRATAASVQRPAPASGCRSPRESLMPISARSRSSGSTTARAFPCSCQSANRTRRTATRRTMTSPTSEPALATKILVVEDDPNIVDLIRSNLTVRGFDTVVSTDGARVLQILETEQPDLILLDLMLPSVDGFELCKQVRERSSVGVVVVSARGGDHDKVAALNLGADDYLTKPFSIDELLARISATLRRTRPAPRRGTEHVGRTRRRARDGPRRAPGDPRWRPAPSDADRVRVAA